MNSPNRQKAETVDQETGQEKHIGQDAIAVVSKTGLQPRYCPGQNHNCNNDY